MSIDQNGPLLGGIATMHEHAYGVYQYSISGEIGPPIRLHLRPMTEASPYFQLGVIEAQCALGADGLVRGRWQSTIGTNGAFTLRKYEENKAAPSRGAEQRLVFISYSHSDKAYLDELLVHLKPLEKKGLIDAWSDERIKAGSLWKTEIEAALSKAKVAILLISPSFLASDFIVENELPPILAKAKENGVRVLPVILRPCRYSRDDSLGPFQAINSPSTPLASLADWERDKHYDRIAHEIESSKA